MTEALAVTWMARLAAVATAIAALELAVVHCALGDGGVFAWPVLRREYAWPRLAGVLFSARGIAVVIAVQLASALALPWTACAAPVWLAAGAQLAISVRFRGTYNGGSDAMLLVVLIALGLAQSAPGTALARAGLAYAAVQLALSYVIAGVAKLRDARWRAGTALPVLVDLPHYAVPPRIAAIARHPAIARGLGTAMLAFEVGFPLALVSEPVCIAMLALGAAFHLANAVAFGLNRFLWTWLAAYPALLFWVARGHA